MPATSFYCPACGECQALSSLFENLSPSAEVKVTCPCGTKWRITVEFHEAGEPDESDR